ncbi:PAS domain-containing hybrid sensor histidine kinase/response regulator [Coleofasciculus sp. LEGE 07081]|uniref:PAS domain-containing hybrid sensor histidine kinase/response regulator n=1 Tax=Coleofasciculus sp. LEGE 07081 TaxID=2777967 RepID=UPI001D14F563|nr:response regulator [Coleofasciculus sp. LEGE 07081]
MALITNNLSVTFGVTLSLITAVLLMLQRWQKRLLSPEPNEPETRNRWQSVVQMAGNAIICLSPSYRILEWNQATEQIYGWQRHEVLGRNYLTLLPKVVRDTVAANCQQVLAQKTAYPLEHPVFTSDGQERVLLWHVTPWLDEWGNAIGIIASGQDITERKTQEAALVEAREAALQASQSKSQFLAQMSHEIRTPMNGVLGMVELLQRTNLTLQQQDYSRTISRSAKHLLTVINDILDLSKLEAGETQLEHLDFDLDGCLGTVVDLLAAKAEDKGLELAIWMDSAIPRQLNGDAVRLRQVLLNLVSNAIKFTEAGSVLIHVLLQSETDQTVKIRFAVKDTGIGIAPDLQPKLFEPFVQGNTPAAHKYGGTGLGLSICRKFVKLMRGEIALESNLGEGSTFWFTAEFGKSQISEPNPVPVELAGLKLLVVDGSSLVRQSVIYLARTWEIEVDEVETTAAALTAWEMAEARNQPYDIVLVEENLLDAESVAFLRVMHKSSTHSQTKFLLMSGMNKRQRAEQLLKLGNFSYLVKPITPSRLLTSLVWALGLSVTQNLALGARVESSNSSTPIPSDKEGFETPTLSVSILLAEDDPINQQVILGQLNLLGYRADCVTDGQAVLDRLAQDDYDIVLMDCQMPILDGYETTRLLRYHEQSDRHTVVIALTASAMSTDRDKCLAVGMDDYISKPVELEALGNIVRRWTNLTLPKDWMKPTDSTAQAKPARFPASPTLSEPDCPIDLERLSQLFKNKPDYQQKFLTIFIKEAQNRINGIREAIATEDFASIQQQAHRLKGSSANAGVWQMPEMAQQLEWLAQEKCLETAVELVEALQHCLEGVRVFLEGQKR